MSIEHTPTDAPPLPSDDELVTRFRELVGFLGQIEKARVELAAVDARLHERGIDPNTYEVGPGDSVTTDHKEP